MKRIVEVAARSSLTWIYSAMDHRNQEALQKLRESRNVSVLEFPDEVMAGLKKMTAETLEDEAEKNPEFKRVYEAYKTYRENYSDWNGLKFESTRWNVD